jgi:phosphatidylethanolamine-binding protein
VIDDFLPSLTLAVSWKKHDASLGNTIKPKHLQNQPVIKLHDKSSQEGSSGFGLKYTVTLTDPDAPSHDDPKWSEFCHWIAANVSISQETVLALPTLPGYQSTGTPDDVIEYKPPGPPEKTGKHRYVFLVFAPKNGTTEPLDLSKPADRQHWGADEEGNGVREWATKNELVPVAANFIYSKNKKQ